MSVFLNDMSEFCKNIEANIYYIGAVENGSFDAERIAVNESNNCSDMYSVAKVFTVTAVGLLYDRGLIGLEEKVCDILGDELCPEGMDERWRSVTVDMALQHHTGLNWGFLDIDAADPTLFGKDYLKYLLSAPLVCSPDEKWIYTDAAYYLLSRLVEIRAGENMDDLLREHIYNPLGFREAAFSRCPEGHAMGATGLYVRADDTAKLGALYLHGGMWQERRVISQEWVDIVLKRSYELSPQLNGLYGAYGKGGMYEQMLLVIPEKNRVVAWQGFNRNHINDTLIKFAVEY